MDFYKALTIASLTWSFWLGAGLSIAVQLLGNDNLIVLYALGTVFGLLTLLTAGMIANLLLNAILRIDHAIFNR